LRKCKLIYCEKQISVCLGKGGGRNRGRITKEQEESLEGEGYVHYLDYRDGFELPRWLSGEKKKKICIPIQETLVPSLDGEDPLEKEMATHSSVLAWRIPWTE